MSQSINVGFASEIVNLAVTDSSWTAIGPFSQQPNNMLLRLREDGDLYVSLDNAGTTYLTIPSGQSLTYDWNTGRKGNFLWLKGSIAGTAEIVITYE